MIAKCNYGKFLNAQKQIRNNRSDDEKQQKALMDDYIDGFLEFKKCETKLVNSELLNLKRSLN